MYLWHGGDDFVCSISIVHTLLSYTYVMFCDGCVFFFFLQFYYKLESPGRKELQLERIQGRNSGRDHRAMLLTGLLSCLGHFDFLYIPGLPVRGWHIHRGLGPHTSIISQGNTSQSWSQDSLIKSKLSEFFYF